MIKVSFILSVLATLLFLVSMLCLFGPGLIEALYPTLVLGLYSVGVLGAAWWFGFLGLRTFAARERPVQVRSASGRVGIGLISCFLGVAAVFSVLLVHHGCVCLLQRVEASRANFSCVQVRQIETACAALLEDSGKSTFQNIFLLPATSTPGELSWNAVVPELLLKGCDADAPLDPNVRSRLAPDYSRYFEFPFKPRRWWRIPFSQSLPEDALLDGWDRPLEYSAPIPPDRIPSVRSRGRDGIRDTDGIRSSFLPAMDQDLAAHEFYDAAPVNRTPLARLFLFLTGRPWLSANDNILHNE